MKDEHHHHHEEHHHNTDVHGEHCSCGCGAEHGDHFDATRKEERNRIIIGAVFFALGYVISECTPLPDPVYLICFIVSYVAVGFNVVKEALEQILAKNIFSEFFLISVASLGALVLGDYSEGCAVMLLYAVGEYIQGEALSKSRKKIRELSDAHGFAHSHSNSNTERFIAKFAKVYTPIICAIAALIVIVPPVFLSGEWKEWIYRGLSALVIGCPCAIVISVPLAFSCAIGACTKQGVFIHCSGALENLYQNRKNILNGGALSSDEIMIPEQSEEKRKFTVSAAEKAMRIARENIVFALSVKLVILILAVFLEKEIPIWLAEFGDVGVALLAILNSLRAMKIRAK